MGQGYIMTKVSNKEINQIGYNILDGIYDKREKNVKSLIGQVRILPYNNYEPDSLYNVIKKLLRNEECEYINYNLYSIENPRILAQLALFTAEYYRFLE